MMKKIEIDPISRLEGHGKIAIFLDEGGDVANAYVQIPELRGFEQFAVGRPVEEMPRITPRICGVCPLVHHYASSKACDAVYRVPLPPNGERLRRMIFNAYMFYDHLLHFYYLAAPDFVVGPTADPGARNILGVVDKVGLEIGSKVIEMRAKSIDVLKYFGGKRTHPIINLPGGVSRPLDAEAREQMLAHAREAVEFSKFTFQLFEDVVLKNKEYVDLVLSEAYGGQETYYIGVVNDDNELDFYDGWSRIVDPDGNEFARFAAEDYLDHIEERVEPWSYLKVTYLKKIGWKGWVTGKDSGIYRGGPLATLNAADRMQTPVAQAEYEKFYATLGGKPVHASLAYHWARIIRGAQGAELWLRYLEDDEILDPHIRNLATETPSRGVGIVEAARGHLIHDYTTDENGILTEANLIVSTTQNYAGINLAVRNAARGVITGGDVDEGKLNMVEMAFRAYDPCMACATHALPGKMPLEYELYDAGGELLRTIKRNC
jgi:F420-non-reducing hydrogenase large subunit